MTILDIASTIIMRRVFVMPHDLIVWARCYKTAAFYERVLGRIVKDLYNGAIDEYQFIDRHVQLIEEQFTRAYNAALRELKINADDANPAWMEWLIDRMAQEQDHVYGFADDIIAARFAESGTTGLMARVPMWAKRYEEIYNATLALAGGDNRLVWRLGATEDHCEICAALNGIVAYASEWAETGVLPQNAPNPALAKENGGCGGWQCDCRLEPTDEKRTRGATQKILGIAFG